jgi:putative redox protein
MTNFHFELKNETGHIVSDNRSEFGGNDLGLVQWSILMGGWLQRLLIRISILKKQRQEITSFKAE